MTIWKIYTDKKKEQITIHMRFPKLTGNYVLAPMSGVSDIAFRTLCKRHGAAMTYTEFCSAEGLVRTNPGTIQQALTSPEERPVGIQLFGNNKESVQKAARLVEPTADVIDFNLGCPAWNVLNQGSGSALLQEPQKIQALVEEVSNALHKPFTVKLRLGINKQTMNYLDVAQRCVDAGAVAVTLHPRTTNQGYSGTADWNAIKTLKETLDVPVIGNGDVQKPQDAVRMKEETGCDYVMIGRAARNNPLIFTHSEQLATTGEYDTTTPEKKLSLIQEYVELANHYNIPFLRIKSHALNLTKGIKGARTFRQTLVTTTNQEELTKTLNALSWTPTQNNY